MCLCFGVIATIVLIVVVQVVAVSEVLVVLMVIVVIVVGHTNSQYHKFRNYPHQLFKYTFVCG